MLIKFEIYFVLIIYLVQFLKINPSRVNIYKSKSENKNERVESELNSEKNKTTSSEINFPLLHPPASYAMDIYYKPERFKYIKKEPFAVNVNNNKAWVISDKNVIIVSFRGSENAGNWFQNFRL